jgi:mRNA-degrading endonuclease RelE of RelBE toxin-antitoxin system
MHETPRLLGFVRLASYERSAAEVLTEDDERQLEAALMENPEAGSRVIGAGGARKVRVGRADHGRGKRGGARVIYYYRSVAGRVYLLYAYAKGASDDLSPAGKQLMQQIIATIDQEK